jgi:ankyrin repeat protein
MRKVLATVIVSALALSWGHLAIGQSSHEEMNASLIQAAKEGNTQGARQVIPFGASVDAKDDNGVTVLMWAVNDGNTELMKFLLDKGANMNAVDKDGHTALDRAKASGQTKAAKLLRDTAIAQGKHKAVPAGSTAPK